MRTICFYFQVHQPQRLRRYRFFDIGNDHYYYDDYANRSIMKRIAEKCYLPANEMMLSLIKKHGNKFKISFSITGTALNQFEQYSPEVLDSFVKLAETGNVEFLTETFSHSLASLKSKDEFFQQVELHSKHIEELFKQKPKVFRNTELIYSDGIGEMVAEMGYRAMLTEGAKHILGWKSPNYLYYNAYNPKLKILLKNYKLSDDIAFRFSDKNWGGWPLTTSKYVSWLKELPADEEIINLFMDYETFGEHQWEETGIFDFMSELPGAILKEPGFSFSTPSEVAKNNQPVASLNVPYPISWADEERDLTAWLGNELQNDAFNKLYALQPLLGKIQYADLLKDWQNLQNSDHFYYMCTKFFSDGAVHSYFNPYNSPYDAFINYMNVLSDFSNRLNKEIREQEDIGITGNDTPEELITRYESKLNELKSKITSSPAQKPVPKKTTRKKATPKSTAKKTSTTKKSGTTKKTTKTKTGAKKAPKTTKKRQSGEKPSSK